MRSLLFQTWVLEWIRILDWTIRSVQWSNPAFFRQWTKLKNIFSKVHFRTVIRAFITSRLDDCNSLYVGVSQSTLSGLQLLQNAAARLWTGTWKSEHITPVLSSLTDCLSTFQFQFLLSVFKSLNGLVPAHLSELLHLHSPSQSLRSADQLLLDVLRTRWRLRGVRVFAAVALFFSKVLYK